MPHLNETWSQYQANELVSLTKFHENPEKIKISYKWRCFKTYPIFLSASTSIAHEKNLPVHGMAKPAHNRGMIRSAQKIENSKRENHLMLFGP